MMRVVRRFDQERPKATKRRDKEAWEREKKEWGTPSNAIMLTNQNPYLVDNPYVVRSTEYLSLDLMTLISSVSNPRQWLQSSSNFGPLVRTSQSFRVGSTLSPPLVSLRLDFHAEALFARLKAHDEI